MSKNTGLGKGFDGLIPTGLNVQDVAAPGEQVKQLSMDVVVANPDQPRKAFDEAALQELAGSIKQHGIIQPLVVTPHQDGQHRIVAGERRYRAAKIAGLSKVPVIIRDHKELEELEIALVENVQRVDLSPLETAVSVVRLRDQFSLTPKQIAAKLGKAETTISNIIRLLQLPEEAVEALQKNQITEGHARAILALKTDEKAQKELLNTIITQKLSVREAENLVKQQRPAKNQATQATQKLLKTLPPKLQKAATIQQKPNGNGQLRITYSNEKELRQLINKLK